LKDIAERTSESLRGVCGEPARHSHAIAGCIGRVQGWVRAFLPCSFQDAQTVEEVRRERFKRLRLTASAALASKFVRLGVEVASVPIALSYLGRERYGLWLTIGSLVAWMGLADLGLSNGLKNSLARVFGMNDRRTANGYFTTGLLTLSIIALALAAVFFGLFRFIPWLKIFHADSPQLASVVVPTLVVYALLFFIRFPLGIIGTTYEAFQEGYINHLWAMVSAGASLVALIGAVRLGLSLPWLLLCVSGSGFLVTLASGGYLVGISKPWLRPALGNFSRQAFGQLWTIGSSFFLIQIAVLVVFKTDNFVITYFLGPAEVPAYAVTFRLFIMAFGLYGMVLAPLWPSYAEAAAKKDWSWIRKTHFRMLRIGIIGGVLFAAGMIFFGQRLVAIWTRGQAVPPQALIVVLSLYFIVYAWSSAHGVLLNGLGRVRPQAYVAMLEAGLNITLSLLLVGPLGLTGVALGTFLAISLTCGWMLPLIARRALRGKE